MMCKHCGANSQGANCEYCGSSFLDDIDISTIIDNNLKVKKKSGKKKLFLLLSLGSLFICVAMVITAFAFILPRNYGQSHIGTDVINEVQEEGNASIDLLEEQEDIINDTLVVQRNERELQHSQNKDYDSKVDTLTEPVSEIDYMSIVNSETDREFGNTSGNISSNGLVAEFGGRLFYGDYFNAITLSSIGNDGKNKQSITTDLVQDINLMGERIYYCNWTDNGSLYSVKIDGTDKTKLNDDTSTNLIVTENFIIYQNHSDNGFMYRMDLDGHNNLRMNTEMSDYINTDGERIYYRGDMRLVSTNMNGSDRSLLSGDMIVNRVVLYENRVFYSGEEGITVVNKDGSGRQVIIKLSQPPYDFNIVNDLIFFSDLTDNLRLYSIELDGSNFQKLTDDGVFSINTTKDRIFYRKSGDGNAAGFFSIKLDGSDLQKVK